MLDDAPVIPGDTRAVYEHGAQARQILNDTEDDLREWQPEAEGSFAEKEAEAPRERTEVKSEPAAVETAPLSAGVTL